MVDDSEILKLVRSSKDPQTACENLLNRAKQLGTRDHVTVVVVCGQG